ncbi:hypothetical protein JCM1840_000411 [Sporobolomyces johnsonii]
MSDSAPAAASAAAAVLSLPDELFLLILARPELDYCDLKRFSRVCRRFHAVEKDKALDYKLFRKGPAQPQVKQGYEATVHLMVDQIHDAIMGLWPKPRSVKEMIRALPIISSEDESDDDEELAGGEGKDGGADEEGDLRTLWDSEYATSPAFIRLDAGPYVASNPLGVTVRDVVVAEAELCTMKNGPAPRYGFDCAGVERAVALGDGDAKLVYKPMR